MKKIKLLYILFIVGIATTMTSLDFASAQTPDELVNPGFEELGADRYSAYDWQDFGSGYKRVSTPHSGRWSIQLKNSSFDEQSGAYQRVDLNQTELKPVFIGGYVKGRNIVNSSGGYFGASIYAEIHLNDGSVAYWNSIANYGSFPWRWVGFNTGTLPLVNKPIDYIFVVPFLSNATGVAYFDDISLIEFEPSESAVTLMFDDGEDNAFTEAKPVLDTHSLVASAVIPTNAIGQQGFMTSSQIKNLAASGWEIVSHGINHEDLTTLNNKTMRQELYGSKRRLERLGLKIKNFALPFGAYNADILAQGAKYYRSLRAYELGDNPQGAFPFDVKVRSAVNSTTVEDVVNWINEAMTNKRWSVIVFHGVRDEGDDEYYTTPDTFAEIIKTIKESGINVLTYDQGLDMFEVTQ